MGSQSRAGLKRHKRGGITQFNHVSGPFIIGKFSSNSSSLQDTYSILYVEKLGHSVPLNINLLFLSQLELGTSVSYYFSKDRIPSLAKMDSRPLFKKDSPGPRRQEAP